MKRIVILIAALITGYGSQAQEDNFQRPDFLSIEKQVKDQQSAFYYAPLLQRYKANDTTLSVREYRYLYYGYVFQPDYNLKTERDSFNTIQGILNKEHPVKKDWLTLIRLEQKYLDKAPFDMRDLHLVFIAYSELKDAANAAIYHNKIVNIARTIMATGNGQSEATAFYVISIAHEYDLINLLGLSYTGNQQLTAGKCDYLGLNKNEYNLSGLYFDVKQLFRAYAADEERGE